MQRKEIAIVSLVLLASACSDSDSRPRQVISEGFGLCAALPDRSAYQFLQRSFDYEVGRLTLGDTRVDVYIGYQPDFDGEVWPYGAAPTEDFVYVGKSQEGEVEKLLIGKKRVANRGPVFVMFSGNELGPVESVLAGDGFIVDCDESGGSEPALKQ